MKCLSLAPVMRFRSIFENLDDRPRFSSLMHYFRNEWVSGLWRASQLDLATQRSSEGVTLGAAPHLSDRSQDSRLRNAISKTKLRGVSRTSDNRDSLCIFIETHAE